jgi:phosphomannomutase
MSPPGSRDGEIMMASATAGPPGLPGLPGPLAGRVRAWLADDPDAADRAELTRLCAEAVRDPAALDDLDDRFRAPLRFGTAGLRGPLRAGPGGMNTAVVRRAAAGLAAWLGASAGAMGGTPAVAPLVVIGYDARHRSEAFALDSARVVAGAGLRALVLPGPLPTPVLAFAVRHLRADAGVMVTASHNPAADNGYKVYLGGAEADPGRGAQLVAPADADIERRIAVAGPAAAIPMAETWRRLDGRIVEDYVRAAAAAVLDLAPTIDPDEPDPVQVIVAYTPLHGVGAQTLAAVFAAAGLAAPTLVDEQAAPDPDFPTVSRPNPEEAGTMDRVLALGERIGADVVLATDPDADRCAVAVGGRMLTGDEIGLLLADQVLRRRPGPVATTLVSSSALRALARCAGVEYRETLTGFKWIMRADPGLVFGYEEALGYALVPDLVRDKDGITAALAVALIATAAKRRGRTLLDLLDELSARIGVHETGQRSMRFADATRIATAMRTLRAQPPPRLADRAVTGRRDLLGDGTLPAQGVLPTESVLPTADVFVLFLGDDRVTFRPSGTEPKLKAYFEVVEPIDAGAATQASQAMTVNAVIAARKRARSRLAELMAAVDDLLIHLG